MPIVQSEFALLRHPRLAALATGAWPAWLWSADASRILWANAVGAAMFGADSVSACAARRFDVGDPSAAQIVRLAATLPSGAQERLERLRGVGAGFNRALTCACSRIVVGDGKGAVLVAAAEPAGPTLPLVERLRRLFADRDDAIAVFAPSGALIYANAPAQGRLSATATLSTLGLEALAAAADETGQAGGAARLSDVAFDVAALRLGKDAERVLALTLMPRPGELPVAANAPRMMEPAKSEAQAEPLPQATPERSPEPALAAAAPAPEPRAARDEALSDRRHPLRFVWHMDADGRFGVGSDEFIELVGPRTMAAFGRLWSEIAAELKLDPEGRVARALATRETWSGIVISWPVDDTDARLPVELSGLPVFDRDRSFRGYRGFGVCRDIDRINALAQARRARPIGFMAAPEAAPPPAETSPPPVAPIPPPITEPEQTAVAAPQQDRTPPSVQPAAANVVPFRQSTPPEPKTPPALSPGERKAFRELAQELTARLRGPHPPSPPAAESDGESRPADEPSQPAETAVAPTPPAAADATAEHVLLDRIPIGVLIYRHHALLFANRHFLEWSGYDGLDAIEAAGGLNALFAAPGVDALAEDGAVRSMALSTRHGDKLAVEGRMVTVPWNGASAMALILRNGQSEAAQRTAERALAVAEAENRELKSILDATTDGVITLDAERRVVAVNARAAALCGKAPADILGRDFSEMFAPDSARAVRDYFDRVARGGDGRTSALDLTARGTGDRLATMAMTLSRLGDARFCAMFRDVTARRQSEDELRNAKREMQRATAAKAEFLGKVSHEIRTPLNAMTGFAEVIMAERFGPIGNERYGEYVKDIHAAGTQIVSMLNDLLDLSKIETGQTELSFANVNLNDLTQQCVGLMQPQANRARIIIRTSLTPSLPLVLADERSLRQIVLNLLSNSIKLTGPGGQVIVSTVFSDAHEAVLRVRDTGVGMSEKDIEAALEPFQQTATSGSLGSGGTSFGLPLTKALAQANRANFSIKSAPNAGTLVEIAFPPSRVVGD